MEDSPKPTTIMIANDSHVVLSSIEAARAAESAGLDATRRQMFATAVSELARNIVKYAGSGRLLLREVRLDSRTGVEATAEDDGPGIPDIELAMTDHFSSSGTLGLGLPGVRRMVDEFEITSEPGQGTRVTIRAWR